MLGLPAHNFRAEKRSGQASAHLLSEAQGGLFCVLTVSDCVCLLLDFWVKCTRCERLLPVKHFHVCLFSSLENYFGFRTTDVKGKTDHSVSLRWNKRLWTLLKRRVVFLIVHPINLLYELVSPGWIKTRLYSVISSYDNFFYTPRFITFAEPALSLSSVKEPFCRYNASEWTNWCAY